MTQRRGLLWLVLVALIAAQTLGLMHRVAHHSGANASAAPIAAHAAEGERGHHDGPLAGLFSTHEEPSCPLYDQLGQGGVIPVLPGVPLPLVQAAFVLRWFQGEFLARWVALFDARGPPSVR